jgi:hypothetical protein
MLLVVSILLEKWKYYLVLLTFDLICSYCLHFVQFIFRKDLKRCPTFSMLKTLLLNEWCVAADFGALACFLQHTPVLEKLVLQLRLDVVYVIQVLLLFLPCSR